MNKLYFGDNLEILREMDDACVHLICTDPPFNSGRDYNTFLGDSLAQKKAFTDTWTWDTAAQDTRADIEKHAFVSDTYKALDTCLKGYDLVLGRAVSGSKGAMRAYLAFMGPRLAEMHRILTSTGSLYLHCDPTASHYLKGLMDVIFGVENFRNEIVWKRRLDTHNLSKLHFGRNHDVIFYYGKSPQATYHIQYTDYDPDYIKSSYKHEDAKGPYRLLPCTNESGGNKPYSFKGVTRAWRFSKQKMNQMYTDDLLVQLREGGPYYYKKYLSEAKGVPLQDIWTDIAPVRGRASLGYPTQKPIALYERMIKASSNEGNIVLDPFCGCGTTIDAAHALKRHWIGIDITILALDPMHQRLADRHGLEPSIDYQIEGYPTNMQEVHRLLKEGDKRKYHDFSNWAVTRIGLKPTRDVGDGGHDGVGHITLWNPQQLKETDARVLAEVKTGKPTLTQVRAFCQVMTQNNAEIGIFITIEPVSASMRQQAEEMGTFEHNQRTYPRLQFWQIDDAYFENPESINTLVRLPIEWRIQPRQKSERHFSGTQTEFLRK